QIKPPPKPPKSLSKPKKKNTVADDLVAMTQKETQKPKEDPLLAAPKPLPAWAADLPLLSRPQGTVVAKEVVENAPEPERNKPEKPTVPPVKTSGSRGMTVEVNGKKTLLPGKANAIFVDLFDVYPIDLTKPGGKRMVSRLNGMDIVDFSVPLHEGDHIDLYWEK
ncbi:MAG: hypothetical protein PUC49_03570, partial [Clostridiales bacterium]|nr:hypothetical protein [Clostridiales bacterium]